MIFPVFYFKYFGLVLEKAAIDIRIRIFEKGRNSILNTCTFLK